MNKVFIGGSIRLSRLNDDIRQRLNNIVQKGYPVLVGDANGVDKAVRGKSAIMTQKGERSCVESLSGLKW